MAGVTPNRIKTSDLKSRVLNLSQTSVFQVKLNPPSAVVKLLDSRGVQFVQNAPNIELLCNQVVLPGSNFQTTEVTSNYAGVTERFADRRDYDTTFDMTFYVDRNYKVIDIFDGWMDYISNQLDPDAFVSPYASYRMNYPDGPSGYRGQIFVTKFEKDIYGKSMEYTMVGAYPSQVTSTQLSYAGSQIMSYTVSFNFLRYVRKTSRTVFSEFVDDFSLASILNFNAGILQ